MIVLIRTQPTLLFARVVTGVSLWTTVSFVGTDPGNKYLALGFKSSGTPMWYLVAKQDFLKCAEHITDELVGTKFGRCFRTNLAHIFRCSNSFSANLCIDITSMWYVFVQLRNSGPPQTQYLPLFALFALEAMLIIT